LRKSDNIYDLVEHAAARHKIPRLQLWQETAKAITEKKLPILNSFSEHDPAGAPTLGGWLVSFRASVDGYNDIGPRGRFLKQIIVYTADFERWFRKTHKRRGPKYGTTGYQASDRKAFPKISRLIKEGKARSPHEAALKLAHEGEIAGRGTTESKARRVAVLFRQEHDK
jgi:hypothetical protein